jgi:hypothetical protein
VDAWLFPLKLKNRFEIFKYSFFPAFFAFFLVGKGVEKHKKNNLNGHLKDFFNIIFV